MQERGVVLINPDLFHIMRESARRTLATRESADDAREESDVVSDRVPMQLVG